MIKEIPKTSIKLKAPVYDNRIELFIEGDYNDADYTTKTTIIDLDEFVRIRPILKKLRKHGTIIEVNDKPTVTDAEIEEVEQYFPYAEEDVHTIETIEAWYLSRKDSIRYKITI